MVSKYWDVNIFDNSIILRAVVKFGTEILLSRGGEGLDQAVFENAAAQVVKAEKTCGGAVTIVSSAAIQAGRQRLRQLGIGSGRLDKKDIAGIGARHLLNRWGDAFDIHNRDVGQIWLTFANWKSKSELRSVYRTITHFHNARIIPIINENDVVSDREILLMDQGISENDRLAQMIACLIGADGILFLTKIGGVYERDPNTWSDARMYKTIHVAKIKEILHAPSSASMNGVGGMRAKLIEATKCFHAGMRVAIAGMDDDVIVNFVKGKPVGTAIGTSTSFY